MLATISQLTDNHPYIYVFSSSCGYFPSCIHGLGWKCSTNTRALAAVSLPPHVVQPPSIRLFVIDLLRQLPSSRLVRTLAPRYPFSAYLPSAAYRNAIAAGSSSERAASNRGTPRLAVRHGPRTAKNRGAQGDLILVSRGLAVHPQCLRPGLRRYATLPAAFSKTCNVVSSGIGTHAKSTTPRPVSAQKLLPVRISPFENGYARPSVSPPVCVELN